MIFKKIFVFFLFFLPGPFLLAQEPEKTVTPEPVSFKFVALGDSESMKTGFYPEMAQMISLAKKQNPDFAVFTGDIMSTSNRNISTYHSWVSTFKRIVDTHFNKTYIAFGKHDFDCGFRCVNLWGKILWNRTWALNEKPKLYHSFDHENTHFVLLASEYPIKRTVDPFQLNWLENDLKNTDKPNKIVITHVPPITFFEESAKECHDMSCNKTSRDRLLNILKTYKVDLVISGHEHSFQHKIKNDTDFIISGNSGNRGRYDLKSEDSFSLIEVKGESITVKKINKKEEVKATIKIK